MPESDLLHLLDDGRSVLVLTGQELTLRSPLIHEWRSFIQDFTAAERRVILSVSQLREALGAEEDLTGVQETSGPAYATVLCRIIRTLGEGEEAASVEPGNLPAWCGMPEVIVALEHHWTHVPLAIGSQPRQMVPHAKIPEAVGIVQIATIQQQLLDQLSQATSESTPS